MADEPHAALTAGARLFNEKEFFAAHEAWEVLWLEAGEPLRTYVQGLIQLAAAWHHMQRGNARGARRLLASALRKLEPHPAGFARLDATEALDRARAILASDGIEPDPAPRIRLL